MGMPAAMDTASWGWSVRAIAEWVAFAGLWALFLWSLVQQAAWRRWRRPQGEEAGWAASPEGGPPGCGRRGGGLRRLGSSLGD